MANQLENAIQVDRLSKSYDTMEAVRGGCSAKNA